MKNMKYLIHPYIFVLKEGTDIEQNRLDYNLMMLKITPAEHFPSPAFPNFWNGMKEDRSLDASPL